MRESTSLKMGQRAPLFKAEVEKAQEVSFTHKLTNNKALLEMESNLLNSLVKYQKQSAKGGETAELMTECITLTKSRLASVRKRLEAFYENL